MRIARVIAASTMLTRVEVGEKEKVNEKNE
jgi:hypothetical protein